MRAARLVGENRVHGIPMRLKTTVSRAFFFLVLVAATGLVGGVVYTNEQFAEGNGTHAQLAAVIASRLQELTNLDRASSSVPALAVNPLLVRAAQEKANDMIQKGYFSHYAPDGTSPWRWFDSAGYKYQYAGENLAIFYNESEDVEKAWMLSASHRANILNARFAEFGIALARGTYKGYDATFVVEEFGTPRNAAIK